MQLSGEGIVGCCRLEVDDRSNSSLCSLLNTGVKLQGVALSVYIYQSAAECLSVIFESRDVGIEVGCLVFIRNHAVCIDWAVDFERYAEHSSEYLGRANLQVDGKVVFGLVRNLADSW